VIYLRALSYLSDVIDKQVNKLSWTHLQAG
jgi:hypothetical protein